MHKPAVGLAGLFVEGTTHSTYRAAYGRTSGPRLNHPFYAAPTHQGAHRTGYAAHGGTFAGSTGHRVGLLFGRETGVLGACHTSLRFALGLGFADPVQCRIGVEHGLGRRAARPLGGAPSQKQDG